MTRQCTYLLLAQHMYTGAYFGKVTRAQLATELVQGDALA